jgi:phenylalanyl-tRNA synthetase beta subunit
MQFSYKWLQEYFEESLPEIKDLVETLTFHAFEIEGVEDDLIDIDVLPNRSHDCFCYQGIAKEISVLTGLKLKEKNSQYHIEKELKSSDYISLIVEDPVLIPRATKRFVKNVEVGLSPGWLKEKLESIGQKSINNIVDITNYVMWETGQPVHAFDFDKIAGDGIKEFNIRTAQSGEKITTLDGGEFVLDETIVVISDNEKALDIAGTKGGIVSGIDENTKNVVLSVCNFNQVNIRKTSKKLGLRTDASVRFENGISPDKVEGAMEMLTKLVVDLASGKASEDILDVYPRRANSYKVGVSIEEVNRLLGTSFEDDDIEKILNKLKFNFEKVKPIDKVLALAPTFKGKLYKYGASVSYDAPNEFDCSSFTSYLFAQGGVSIPRVSIDQYVWGSKIEKDDLQAGDLIFFNTQNGKIHTETVEYLKGQEVKEGVDHTGLYFGDGKIIHASRGNGKKGEVIVEDLKNSKYFKQIIGYRRMSDGQERFVVTVSHERLDLRIKEDLIEEIGRVYGYKNIESVVTEKVFEPKIDKTFYYINKIKNILVEVGFDEVQTYVFGDKGKVEVQKSLASNLGLLRTNLKNGLQKSLELNLKNAPVLGLDEIKIFEIGKVFGSLDDEKLYLGIGVTIAKKMKVNKAEILRQEIIKNVTAFLEKELDAKIESEAQEGVVEINLDNLIEQLPEPKSYEDVLDLDSEEIGVFKKISSYPFMLRDIAVFVPNENSAKDILTLVKENAGELLVQTKLFDTYSPEGEDKTSYAFNLVFQSQEKTLTDEEINKIMEKITLEIETKNWEVR